MPQQVANLGLTGHPDRSLVGSLQDADLGRNLCALLPELADQLIRFRLVLRRIATVAHIGLNGPGELLHLSFQLCQVGRVRPLLGRGLLLTGRDDVLDQILVLSDERCQPLTR